MNDILNIQDVKKYFPITKGILSRKVGDVKAVDRVSFSVEKGEIFGLVGESGSGKSTLGYTVMDIYHPTSGKIVFNGEDMAEIRSKNPKQIKKEIQIVFQDPGSSLNPRRTIEQTIELPLKVHNLYKNEEGIRKIREMLERVELPSDYMHKYASALSGGQKQRVAIARALATEPSFIVLDEPTSALDVSVQGKIISLLLDLRKQFDLSFLFITHDLSLMRNVASRVAIMYLGKIFEIARTSEFFQNPLHPYTKMLLSSIPVVSKDEEKLKPEKVTSIGEVPSPVNAPPGCSFHPRCNQRMDICNQKEPKIVEVKEGHTVKCHLFSEE